MNDDTTPQPWILPWRDNPLCRIYVTEQHPLYGGTRPVPDALDVTLGREMADVATDHRTDEAVSEAETPRAPQRGTRGRHRAAGGRGWGFPGGRFPWRL